MSVKPAGLLLLGGGGVLIWSAIQNKQVTSVLRELAGGNSPSKAVAGPADTSPANAASPAADTYGYGAPPNNTSNDVAGLTSGSATDNYMSIAEYLVTQGYTDGAAAGVVGCVAGESAGNPEAVGTGGAGLIGWTPPSSMTQYGGTCHAAGIGNQSTDTDFANQCAAIVAYNNAQGSQFVSELNSSKYADDPVGAADFYSQTFERPAVTDSDVRSGVATSVYSSLVNRSAPTSVINKNEENQYGDTLAGGGY